jgi:hypothetical protein
MGSHPKYQAVKERQTASEARIDGIDSAMVSSSVLYNAADHLTSFDEGGHPR